jgi:CBS domain containing-hemolysin-like protein
VDEGILSSSIALLVLLVCTGLLTLGYNALMNAPKPHLAALAEEGRPRAALALRLGQDATILLITYQICRHPGALSGGRSGRGGHRAALARGLAGAGLAPTTAFVLAELIVLFLGAGVMLIAGGRFRQPSARPMPASWP